MRAGSSAKPLGRVPGEIPWPFSNFYDRYVNRYLVNWFKQIAEDVSTSLGSGIVLDVGTGPGRLPIEIARRSPEIRSWASMPPRE